LKSHGGLENKILSGFAPFIGGGLYNEISGGVSTVGGGASNRAYESYAAIAGGSNNEIRGEYSFIGGGAYNVISGDFSVVVGGNSNQANGSSSFVGGGSLNFSSGDVSSIIGGANNLTITGADYSSINGGFGALADRYGMEARSSSYFEDYGDGQRIAFTLYLDTSKSSFLSLDNGSLQISDPNARYDIFNKSNAEKSAAFVTCQLVGHDAEGNVSQICRKLIIKKDGATQTIVHLESVGTDLLGAGSVDFSTYNGIFYMPVDGNSYKTYWIAHVYGVEIIRPTDAPELPPPP
jgi:hypothetical protein